MFVHIWRTVFLTGISWKPSRGLRPRWLHIESVRLLTATDLQFDSVIRQCPRLETLRLHPNVQRYWPGEDTDTLSLGCLVLILSHCPLLSFIEGCFNLDQEKLPRRDTSTPHDKLRHLDLGRSYFVTPEPEGWVPITVGYLASLSLDPCNIVLSHSFCAVGADTEEELGLKRIKRQDSIRQFDHCVLAVNSMKSFSKGTIIQLSMIDEIKLTLIDLINPTLK